MTESIPTRAKALVRASAHRLGVDIGKHPMRNVVKILNHFGIATVADVGANVGGYGRDLRRAGYRGRIVSFEPLPQQFAAAESEAARDAAWTVYPYALGAEHSQVTMNVAANNGASSSVLPMLARHEAAAPEAKIIGSATVEQRKLDDVWDETLGVSQPAFVKIDVQGYERRVLDGAAHALKNGLIRGLQLELSVVPLYADGWTWQESFDWAADNGFELYRILPGFTDNSTGRMLQADAIFMAGR